ncbi:unnamed protein product [Alternaria alternata]
MSDSYKQPPPVMERLVAGEASGMSVYDRKLKDFLLGNNDEPQDRIARQGAPSHRAQYRGQDLWKRYFNHPSVKQAKRVQRATKSFSYEGLNLKENHQQIRLLRIHPQRVENFDETVVCDLYVVDLARVKNKFEALSYCWGDSQADQIISIHRATVDEMGQLHCGPAQEFPVRSNLHQALKHLRHTTQFVSLWVDAICIDQRDRPYAAAEKNRQLSMMSEIYNCAKNVCIWLGDPDEQSSKALSFVHKISNFEELEACLRIVDEATTGQWMNLVETLKKTQWFSRRWIIQEIASARSASVHCGHNVVHWDDLAVAISILEENQAMIERAFSPKPIFAQISNLSATQLVKSLTHVYRKFSTGEIAEKLLDLETLVCTFQQSQARFPEDVIHSVRALAHDSPGLEDFEFSANNDKGTPGLFIAFVHRCIERSRSRDIICRHWAPPVTDTSRERVQLPSWISDLTNAPFGLPGTSHERQNGENFVAISPHRRWKQYNASGTWNPNLDEYLSQKDSQVRVPSAQTRWSTGNVPMPSISSKVNGAHAHGDTSSPSLPTARFQNPPNVDALDELSLRDAVQEPSPRSTDSLNFTSTNGEVTSVPASPTKGHKRSITAPAISAKKEINKTNDWNSILSAFTKPNGLNTIKELADPARPLNHQNSRSLQGLYIQEGKEQVHHMEHADYLSVPGFILGTIEKKSDTMREGVIPGDWIAMLRGDKKNVIPDSLWRTLVADRTENGNNLPEWYKRACLHCLEDSRFVNSQGDLNTYRSLSDTPLDTMTSKYLERAKSVIWRRRFIQLKLGAAFGDDLVYGLAPERCKKGDVVCIIGGCSVPVVLRKIEDLEVCGSFEAAGVFTLIGETYIHQKMNGEAVQDLGRVKKLQNTFVLK